MERSKYLPFGAISIFAIFVGFIFTRESKLISLLEKYSSKLEDFENASEKLQKQPQKIYKIRSHQIAERTIPIVSTTPSSSSTEPSDFVPDYHLHQFEPEVEIDLSAKFANISAVEQRGLLGRFLRRKSRLIEFCSAWSKEGRVTHKFNNQKIGVAFPEAKLLLCAPWKCGSSFWRQYVVALHKKIAGPGWSDKRIRGEDPVYAHLPPEEKRKLLYSPETVSILVVRHPFIRLISAWNEKFHRDYQYGYSMFRRERNLQKYAKERDATHWISFADFARWIAFDDYQLKNKHFRPQSYMCPPCGTRFQDRSSFELEKIQKKKSGPESLVYNQSRNHDGRYRRSFQ